MVVAAQPVGGKHGENSSGAWHQCCQPDAYSAPLASRLPPYPVRETSVQESAPAAMCRWDNGYLDYNQEEAVHRLCDWINQAKYCTAFDFPTKGIVQVRRRAGRWVAPAVGCSIAPGLCSGDLCLGGLCASMHLAVEGTAVRGK
jgi:hypothetical protein